MLRSSGALKTTKLVAAASQDTKLSGWRILRLSKDFLFTHLLTTEAKEDRNGPMPIMLGTSLFDVFVFSEFGVHLLAKQAFDNMFGKF